MPLPVPPAVPALPDTQRITTYTLSSQTGPFAVNFAIYGDGNDYTNWIEVWLNDVLLNSGQYTLTSPSGSISTIARPITDAVITLTTSSSGPLVILGARRPRRLTQFAENRGVPARDLNQAITDIVAELREAWDFARTRQVYFPGGENIATLLPNVAGRANKFFAFDGAGNPVMSAGGGGGGGGSPGGLSGQIQFNNAGAFGGLTDAQVAARVGGISNVTPQQFGALGDNSGTLANLSQIQNAALVGVYSTFDTLDAIGIQEAMFASFASASPAAPANAINVSSGGPSGGLTIAASANTIGGVLGGGSTQHYYYDPNNANFYVQQLAEGNTTPGALGGVEFNQSNRAAANFWIRFDFRQGAVLITEAKWFQTTTDTHGVFQWQGWNGFGWVNIGTTFTLGGATTQTQTTLNGNVTSYSSYRLLGISGNLNTTPQIAGIQFKQAGVYITTNRSSSIAWNAPNSTSLNKTLYIPNGRYTINRQILTVAQNAEIWFQSRNDARWIWTGDANTAMWLCDSLAYARVINPSFALGNGNNILYEPFWDLDGTGGFGGLFTQQITVYDMVSNGPSNSTCPYGVAISRIGNSGQGDTILYINPFIANQSKAAIQVNGQNALSVQVINGDIQFCLKDGFRVNGGSLFCFGTSFQNEGQNFNNLVPMRNQIRQGGYDFTCQSGAGDSVTNRMMEARSESDAVAFNSGNQLTITGGGNSAATQSDWSSSYHFTVGSLIFPTTNNTKNRAFMVVDTGGPPDNYPYGWHDINYAGSDATHIKDAGSPGWTVNQWAGFTCGIRFGNSFVDWVGILSNTADTLTIDTPDMDNSNTAILYAIVGVSGVAAPNFDSVQDTTISFNFSGVFPWSVTQNNNVLNATGFSTSDFSPDGGVTWNGGVLLAGEADQYGKPDGSSYLQTGLIAKIIGTPGANQWTMNRNAGLSANSTGCAYGGRLLADGNLKWMHVPFPMTLDVINDGYNLSGGGRVYDGGSAESINMGNVPTNQLALSSGFQYGSNSGQARNFNIKLALDLKTTQPFTITTNPQSLGSFINTDTFLVSVSATGTITCNPDASITGVQLTRKITIFLFGNFAGTITLGSGFRPLTSPALTFTGGGNQMFCSEFVLASLFGTAQWVEVSRVGPT
jgi:hypothetical protein